MTNRQGLAELRNLSKRVEKHPASDMAAVNLKLQHVFAGEGVGRFEVKKNALVYWLVFGRGEVVKGFIVSKSGLESQLGGGFGEVCRYFGIWTRDPDYCDGRFPPASGQAVDGVLKSGE